MKHYYCLAIGCALALPAHVASADENMRIGGFVGAHIFNDNLELGTYDAPDVDTPQNAPTFGVRAGYSLIPRLTLEGELAISPTRTRIAQSDLTIFAWRASAVVDVPVGDRLRPFALAGFGALTSSPVDREILDEDTDLAAHLGAGIEMSMSPNWGIRLDVRTVFAPTTDGDYLTTDLEMFVGLYKGFSAKAPPAPADADGDGVFDADDKCAGEKEDQDGFQDEDGCADLDNDQDSVPDSEDKCPAEKETVNGIDDADGCPETDGDADGILGSKDLCPNDPEDKDGFQDEDGCLDLDNDGDSIPDAADQCPSDAANTPNGCPAPAEQTPAPGTTPTP